LKLKKKGEAKNIEKPCKGIRKIEKNRSIERKNLVNVEKNMVLAKREERKKKEKKIKSKKRREWQKKQDSFHIKGNEIKNVYFSSMPLILFMYNKAYFNTNELDLCISSVCVSLLQDYKDIFPDKIPSMLAKWVEFIEMFSFMIKYKQSNESIVVDALSRRYVLLSTLNLNYYDLSMWNIYIIMILVLARFIKHVRICIW